MIRNQKKTSSLAIVPGIRMDLNPLSQISGSARILRNFIPERGRLIRKGFAPDYTVQAEAATSTGATNPSSGASLTGTGDVAWTSPSLITASDDSDAFVTLTNGGSGSQNPENIEGSGFSFSLPTDVTILGFTATVEGESSKTGSIGIASFDVFLSKDGTALSEVKSGDNAIIMDGGEATETFGGASDDWNFSGTIEDINDSNFGLTVTSTSTQSVGDSVTLRIDNIQLNVFYAAPVWHSVDFSYYRSNAPEKKLIIFRTDGKVYERQSSYEQEIFPGTTSFSILAKKPFVGQLSNRLFFSDGNSSYVYDGRTVEQWGQDRTTDAPAVSAVAAGSLTASTGLKAAVSWVKLDEAGNRVHESPRTDKSGFQVLSSEDLRIDISSLTAPSWANRWSGYVSELDGSEILRRTNTSLLTTTTFDVTSLPAATQPKAPIRNDAPPASTVGTVAKNRIFVRDDSAPNNYWFSALGEVEGLSNGAGEESFPGADSTNSISDLVNNDFIPDREIRAIVEHEDIVFLFSETRGYGLLGQANLLDNRAPRSLVKLQVFTEGCIGPDGAVSTPYGLAFMNSARKIYLWAGGRQLIDIGEPIQKLLDDTEGTDISAVDMEWYSGNGRQWLVVTLESAFGTDDSSNLEASQKRALIYDFSLPVPRPDQRTDPGTWFEWVDHEYTSVGVFEEESGRQVLLLGTENGDLKQGDVIAQPFHAEFTAIPSKMYANDTEQNIPAALMRSGLLRPAGDQWVTGQYVDINTGSQVKHESLTTQPTITSAVDPLDPEDNPGISLTLDSALTVGDRRAWLVPESSGNTNVGGALGKSFVLEASYSSGAPDALETNSSRDKSALNALYKLAFTWSPQKDTSQ